MTQKCTMHGIYGCVISIEIAVSLPLLENGMPGSKYTELLILLLRLKTTSDKNIYKYGPS